MITKVSMIGCGKLGLPCAEEMANHYQVKGYDVVNFVSSKVAQVSFEEAVKFAEIIFVAVPTPHLLEYGGETPSSSLQPKNFDYSIVEDVLVKINAIGDKTKLVVLISTVLPGTVRKRFSNLISNFRFVYNPYLIAMGSVAWDMINPEMVIIGTEHGDITGDAQILFDFYKPLMKNNPRFEIGTWEEAESIKIFYNTFISTKLSLVNMIQDVAEKLGHMNVDIVTNALAKSDIRIMGPNYMRAGLGDSGACHPRDNIALRWLSQDLELSYDLFGAIMHSREIQAKNLADKLKKLSLQHSMPIWIHGKTYKPNVPYTHGSYSLLIEHYLRQDGIDVNYVDPLTDDFHPQIKGVVLMAHHAPTTYRSTGIQHLKDKQRFYTDILKGSIVVDPWRYLTQDDIPECKLISYGDTRRPIAG